MNETIQIEKLEQNECIIRYLRNIDDKNLPKDIKEWKNSELEKLQKEHYELSLLNASDEDIIIMALIEMANIYRANYRDNIVNKIMEVRTRFIESQIESQDKIPVPESPKVKVVHEGFNPFESSCTLTWKRVKWTSLIRGNL